VATLKHSGAKRDGESASQLISNRIAELDDWRGEMLGRIRALLKEAEPDIVEEWKWMGTPVFSHNGIVCTGESYKQVVKMTFAKGAALKDPSHLFNSSLDGNVRRAIDIREGEKVNEPALKALIREAVALNASGKKAGSPKKAAAPKTSAASKTTAAAPKKAASKKATPAPKKKATPAPKKKAASSKRGGR
jgi:hypothetical protein